MDLKSYADEENLVNKHRSVLYNDMKCASKIILFPFRRETQESKKPMDWIFTSNDIIIVHVPIKHLSRKVLIVEYAVVKTINENIHVIDSKMVREAVTKGSKNGIAGYEVMLVKEDKGTPFNTSSFLDPQTKTRVMLKSSDGFKIGFAVVLVLMITIIVVAASIFMIRR